ncbi:MAG: CDP-alcohol phosphatidyltransferase family protein [Deltaproteobacteria bacterium]|nr:MAG: CDP-alcohol phosphatidyltransferase family protein [Deltaproteobacteria bacterium]
MLGSMLNHKLDPYLYKLAEWSKGFIRPNHITLIGLIVNLGAAFALALGKWKIGGIAILVAGLFDLLDGAVARSQGQVTPFGGFFDSVIDRYSDFSLFVGLLFYYAYTGHPFLILLASTAAMGSFLVPFTRARAETVITSCKVGLMERPERIILLALGALLDWMIPILWILAILTHITVIQRVLHTKRELRGS